MLKLKVMWLLVLLGVPIPTNDTIDLMSAAVYTDHHRRYDGLSRVVGIQVSIPDTDNLKCLEAIAKIEEYSDEQAPASPSRE